MRQSEALENLRTFVFGLQKARSILSELYIDNGPLTQDTAAQVWPWLIGHKCPLGYLVAVLDYAEKTGRLCPFDYMNTMQLLHMVPEAQQVILGLTCGDKLLPAFLPAEILSGWDDD